jgi:hypothetical protein
VHRLTAIERQHAKRPAPDHPRERHHFAFPRTPDQSPDPLTDLYPSHFDHFRKYRFSSIAYACHFSVRVLARNLPRNLLSSEAS